LPKTEKVKESAAGFFLNHGSEMTKDKLILPGLALFLLMFVTSPFIARAEERVLSFDVTAAMQSDGAMIVTERIRVNIEHKTIRHGITHAHPIKERHDGRKLRHCLRGRFCTKAGWLSI